MFNAIGVLGIVMFCVFFLILLFIVIAFVKAMVKYRKKIKFAKEGAENSQLKDMLKKAFGEGNILSVSKEMSRITVKVKDIDAVQGNILKELGAGGVLLCGDAVKCSFNENIDNIYRLLLKDAKNE